MGKAGKGKRKAAKWNRSSLRGSSQQKLSEKSGKGGTQVATQREMETAEKKMCFGETTASMRSPPHKTLAGPTHLAASVASTIPLHALITLMLQRAKKGKCTRVEYGEDSQQTAAVPRSSISRPYLAAGQLPSGRHRSLLSGQSLGQGPGARGLALEGPHISS